MIPLMLKQGYTALAVAFDVWGVANMVKDGMDQARAVIEENANAENGTAKEANGAKGVNDN